MSFFSVMPTQSLQRKSFWAILSPHHTHNFRVCAKMVVITWSPTMDKSAVQRRNGVILFGVVTKYGLRQEICTGFVVSTHMLRPIYAGGLIIGVMPKVGLSGPASGKVGRILMPSGALGHSQPVAPLLSTYVLWTCRQVWHKVQRF